MIGLDAGGHRWYGNDVDWHRSGHDIRLPSHQLAKQPFCNSFCNCFADQAAINDFQIILWLFCICAPLAKFWIQPCNSIKDLYRILDNMLVMYTKMSDVHINGGIGVWLFRMGLIQPLPEVAKVTKFIRKCYSYLNSGKLHAEIIPVPKKNAPVELKVFQPVTLTSILAKSLNWTNCSK